MDLTLNKEEIAKVISTLSAHEIQERLEYNWQHFDYCKWQNSWLTLTKKSKQEDVE